MDIIVIGGGPAGVTAALRASELGANVTLVERGRMGGTCTNDGCVPTRVLAKASRLLREAQQFADYGLLAPAPVLDFRQLMATTQRVVYRMHEKKQLLSSLESSGVKLYSESGPAQFIDPYTIELGERTKLQADKFILCAGGRARRLDFPGAELSITHADLWSMDRLPKSVVIAGSAATGCQVASILSAFGVQVSMLERSPRILAAEDEAVSQVIQTAFHERGINIFTQIENIQSIQKNQHGLDLIFTVKGEPIQLETETVILSTGWLGNLDALNLPAAKIETQGNYIRVDEYLRTTSPHIFAAGDITGRMMLVQSASYEGIVAAENAVLGVGRRYEHKIVPHGGFTDPEYGSVGLTEARARVDYDCVVSVASYADLDRAVIDGHPIGLCKLIVNREDHRLLGAHVVGEQALEVVEVAAAAMASGMWIEQLAELEIAYPTFTAILGSAARDIVYQLGVQPLAREWQAMGRLRGAEWEMSSDEHL